MSSSIELTGKRFNKLTVLRRLGKDKYNYALWECKCDCGNITTANTTDLKTGRKKSCGCLRKQQGPREDLTGRIFGKLTVIEVAGRLKTGHTLWRCKCDCGNEIVVRGSLLTHGHTKSCGCISRTHEDLTGRKIGRLTVIREAGKDKYGLVLWLCKCDCGNKTIASTSALKAGRHISCGCARYGHIPQNFKDLTGKRFGRLTVVRQVGKTKLGALKYLCKCDCGKGKIINASNLRSGRTTSCGCFSKEVGARSSRIRAYGKTFTDKGVFIKRLQHKWRAMRQLCNNPKHKYYKLNGGKGITVCAEWQDNYPAFQNWALTHGYGEGKEIIRVDTAKDFSPDNCRVIRKERVKPDKYHIIDDVTGRILNSIEAAGIVGVASSTIRKWYNNEGLRTISAFCRRESIIRGRGHINKHAEDEFKR